MTESRGSARLGLNILAVGLCLLTLPPESALFAQTKEGRRSQQRGQRRRNERRHGAPRKFSAQPVRYDHGPDSTRKEGVPEGKVTDHVWKDSKVFPETIRRYSVYIPAQYDQSMPAALMVFQDGHTYLKKDGDFRVPAVFDNLIHAKEMPVTIGVFIDPGYKRDELPPERGWGQQPENRSFEYDSLSGDYATFLLTEILPAVRKR